MARQHHRLEVAAEQQRIDRQRQQRGADPGDQQQDVKGQRDEIAEDQTAERGEREGDIPPPADLGGARRGGGIVACLDIRSEEHTSELQSLMRISYAVFCLKKKKKVHKNAEYHDTVNE